MLHVVSAIGLLCMVGLAWALSENRRKMPWRLVVWGLVLQFGLGLLLLRTPLHGYVFEGMRRVVNLLSESTQEGAEFVFGNLTKDFTLSKDAVLGAESDFYINATFAFKVLPIIIFVSAVSAILYHLRVIQTLVHGIAWLMRRTLKTSGAETFVAGLLVFLGMESAMAIRGYLKNMTRSELCTLMTTFMATIAGSVMVVYASYGADPGHLLAASLMSAPAAILISKVMVPETGVPETQAAAHIRAPVDTHNVVDAAAHGTAEGLKIALNVGALVLVFIGLIHLLNQILMWLTGLFLADGFGFVDVMGYVFRPFAFLLGVPREDVGEVGRLLGIKTVINEFLAYVDLRAVNDLGLLQPRSHTIATYALCGFANPCSLGIAIAVLTGLVPERRKDVVGLGVKCLVGGTLACFMTACIAGILLVD